MDDISQYNLMLEGKSYKIDNYLLKKQKQCAKKLSKINKRYFELFPTN